MIYKEGTTKEHWDALKTREDLFAEFDADYESNETMKAIISGRYGGDPEMGLYYGDDEFKTVAEKIRKAAAPLLPLLKDVLKHLPESELKGYSYEERAEGRIQDPVLHPWNPDGLALYTAVLIMALEKDYINRLAEGIGIPELRAGRRAFQRYKAYKDADAKRKADFEKTEAFRVQSMELKLGIRDHIDYPEE